MARLFVVALYVVCLLAPHAALAIGAATAHCLTERAASHAHHEDGGAAQPAASSIPHPGDAALPIAVPGGDSPTGMCCGVFCLTGLPAAPVANPAIPTAASWIAADIGHSLAGRGPARIIRPPKA